MTDDHDPTEDQAASDGATDDAKQANETNETTMHEQTHDDDRLRRLMKASIGAAVAEAPEPPTVEAIAARIGAAAGAGPVAPASGSAAPATVIPGAGDPRPDDLDLRGGDATGGVARPGGAARHPGSWWPRVVLAAAAILAVLAIGAVLVDRADEPDITQIASDPDPTGPTDPAAGPTAPTTGAVAALPASPPGQVLVGISHNFVDGQGEGTVLRYHLYSGRESLTITSTVFDPAGSVPDTGESGSIERWGDRDVTLDEDGRRAQFVDPAGLLVEVTGEPEDVAAVVPTLVIADAAAWGEFLDTMSAEIEALQMRAAYAIEAGGPEGLDIEGVDRIRISVHADPDSTALSPVPAAGIATTSGVVAGTCLTVDDDTTCRPADPMGMDVPRDVETSYDVLLDGEWWQFGWVTGELSSVTLQADAGGEAEAFWYFEGTGHGDSMTWFAARLPAEAQVVTTELGGSGGFQQVRPAS